MQLQTIIAPAKPAVSEKVSYEGQAGGIDVESGKSLKVEISPEGNEILAVTVPEGKRWVVYVQVKIQESDA